MKQSTCKHCKQVFDTTEKPSGWMANHSRWCDKNPKRMTYKQSLIKARSARKNFNNQFSYGATVSEETREKQRIASTGRKHTEVTRKKMSEAALASKHRRLRKGVVEYKGILLDSSWELALAKRLDNLNVIWIRPNPLEWVDKNGVKHNYFPDFYLTEYDIYIDPKNPHAIQVQKEKLEVILSQYKNIIILDTLNKCKEFLLDNL
jgi:hypothetical protein